MREPPVGTVPSAIPECPGNAQACAFAPSGLPVCPQRPRRLPTAPHRSREPCEACTVGLPRSLRDTCDCQGDSRARVSSNTPQWTSGDPAAPTWCRPLTALAGFPVDSISSQSASSPATCHLRMETRAVGGGGKKGTVPSVFCVINHKVGRRGIPGLQKLPQR